MISNPTPVPDVTPSLPSRQVLPLSGGVCILPGSVTAIVARTQSERRGTRLVVKNPERWVIHAIKRVEAKMSFDADAPYELICGEMPGEAFRVSAPGPGIDFGRPLTCRENLVVEVSYVGPQAEGEAFEACLFCTDEPGDSIITDAEPIPPDPARIERGTLSMTTARRVIPGETMGAFLPPAPAWPPAPRDGFWPEHLLIEEAEDWEVNDVRVGGTSRFLQVGEIPGAMFSERSSGPPIDLGLVRPGNMIEVVATYLGADPTGSVLRCTLSGPIHAADRSAARLPYFLPMSSGVQILANTTAQVTARPQPDPSRIPDGHGFRARRIVVDRPGDWVFNDLKIGNCSELLQSGDVPGVAFSAEAAPDLICARPAYANQDVVLKVTNIEPGQGSPFRCGMMGDVVPLPRDPK